MTAAAETKPGKPGWREGFAVYLKPRVLIVLFLGFSAGLPLALSGSTLLIWMREAGVDLGTIGLFALVGTPYTAKFLWAPLVDALDVPVLSQLLGRRRGWLVFSATPADGGHRVPRLCDPAGSALLVAIGALLVAAASATQDIVIDAFRVESHERERAGRRHGVLRRGLSYRYAGFNRRRAVPGERLRRAGARPSRRLERGLRRHGRAGADRYGDPP